MRTLQRFLKGERGQDIIDYALRTAFIAFASTAVLMTTAGSTIQGILSEISRN